MTLRDRLLALSAYLMHPARGPLIVRSLLGFQILCAAVLILDVGQEIAETGLTDLHLMPELLAVLSLLVAVVFIALVSQRIAQRQAQLEKGMSVASGALSSLIDGYFAGWGLTPSEEAVATYTIKGYSIAEIAELRRSAEGTVKTHLNAIYRKAGVTGRAQLVSLLVEDLMRESLVVPEPVDPAALRSVRE